VGGDLAAVEAAQVQRRVRRGGLAEGVRVDEMISSSYRNRDAYRVQRCSRTSITPDAAISR